MLSTRDAVDARRRRRIPSAQAPDLLDANIEMMWFCYCWMSMALLESYYIAKCCYYVFGSYLQGPLVKGELGAAYVLAMSVPIAARAVGGCSLHAHEAICWLDFI